MDLGHGREEPSLKSLHAGIQLNNLNPRSLEEKKLHD